MAVVNNWRYVETFDDWMRMIEKRLMHEERRPSVTTASDIMGPGLGPHAVEVRDWNDDVTLFNGIFFSEPGSINSPDDNKAWIGESQATESGYGLQTVWDYQSGVYPPQMMVRTFTPEAVFGDWVPFVSGSGGGGSFGGVVWGPWQPVTLSSSFDGGIIRYRRSLDGSLVDLNINDLSVAVDQSTGGYGNLSPDLVICTLPTDAFPDALHIVSFPVVISGVAAGFCGIAAANGNVILYTSTLDGSVLADSNVMHGSVVYGAETSGGGTGGGGTVFVQEEDVTVVTGATTLNFRGNGVTATAGVGAGEAVITVGGGTFEFVQGSPVSVWVIDHPLSFLPNVTVVDSSGRQVEGDVVYTDADTITINFTAAFSGKAYLS